MTLYKNGQPINETFLTAKDIFVWIETQENLTKKLHCLCQINKYGYELK